MTLTTFLQLLISGIALGFIYALIGIEYTIVWNATGLLNFSHGKLIVLGAYLVAVTFCLGLGLPMYLAFIAGTLCMIAAGVMLSTFVFNPLKEMPMIYSIMGTILLGNIIVEVLRLVHGASPFSVPGLMQGVVRFNDIALAKANLYIIAIAVVVVTLLTMFMNLTMAGKAMKAVSQNKKAAQLMGINVNRCIQITGAISAVICMIIGFVLIPLYNVSLSMDAMLGLKGFAAGVVGGFGYLPGCIAGGLVVGIIESMSAMVIPSIYKDAVAFIVLIIFLMFRPSGLMGKKA